MNVQRPSNYRGRIAPSPTGLLHLGHARTFWIAQERAVAAVGTLIYRNEDLDPQRSRPEFVQAAMDDLRWFGIDWQEGPDLGGPHAPYDQSARLELHRRALEKLIGTGLVYACTCSRRDIQAAGQAPHAADDEPVYPGTCRERLSVGDVSQASRLKAVAWGLPAGTRFSLRFRVPDGEAIAFDDGALGTREFTAGSHFGDFVLWRHDDVPAYQIAVVTDDLAMGVTEVVRGADLLVSTARQLLLYRALGRNPPAWYHCPLVRDEAGERLAKRSAALSLRALREAGNSPDEVRAMW